MSKRPLDAMDTSVGPVSDSQQGQPLRERSKPRTQKVDKQKDVDQMNKDALMKYARDILGAETRRVGVNGKKRRGVQWRM